LKIYLHNKEDGTVTREDYDTFSLDDHAVYFYKAGELRPIRAESESDLPANVDMYLHDTGSLETARMPYPPLSSISRFTPIFDAGEQASLSALAKTHFHNGIGVTVGFNGRCYLSTNDGVTWEDIADRLADVGNSHLTYCNVYNNIILVGGWDNKHYISTNSGETFTAHDVDNLNQKMWVIGRVGDNVVLSGHELNDIARITVSTDSGVTWNSKNVTGMVSNISGLSFRDNGVIWVSGSETSIYKSDDLGDTWQEIETGVTSPNDLSFFTITGLAVQGDTIIGSTNDELIIRSVDGGATWEHITVKDGGDFSAVQFIDASTILLLGFGGLAYISIDTGKTWRRIDLSYVDTGELSVGQIAFRGVSRAGNKIYTNALWKVFEITVL